MPQLKDLETESLAAIWDTNAGAPHALTRSLLPALLAGDGILLSISSDAGVEHYRGWGGYGAAKAALEHLTLTFAEETGVTAYAVDPGDMDTQLHRDAEPGEDLSHLPKPEDVVPHLLALLDARPASGRYRAADFPAKNLTGVA
jgi:NAD(P)-dependent dehydrogenase (short-subunit alcohol dehydrogenase family)